MKLLPDDILKYINNIVHEDTQLGDHRVDLTVDAILRPARAGALDFGGSEFQPMETETIQAVKKDTDDDYGWWNLQAGTFQAKFNEEFSLEDDLLAFITPHCHAAAAGLLSNTRIISSDDTLSLNFEVPRCGCNIKENARFATAYLFEY